MDTIIRLKYITEFLKLLNMGIDTNSYQIIAHHIELMTIHEITELSKYIISEPDSIAVINAIVEQIDELSIELNSLPENIKTHPTIAASVEILGWSILLLQGVCIDIATMPTPTHKCPHTLIIGHKCSAKCVYIS